MSTTKAYPLQWPTGRPRTPRGKRRRGAFGQMTGNHGAKKELTVHQAIARVRQELDRLGARNVLVNSDLRVRLDGGPIAKQRAPEDPGVCVYFALDGEAHCLACDQWNRIADNLAAIAKHVEATRGQARWGVGDARTLFAGFKALPDPGAGLARGGDAIERAARVLAEAPGRCDTDIERSYAIDRIKQDPDVYRDAYRHAAKQYHPDAGGSDLLFKGLQAAKSVLDAHHNL